MLQEMLDEFYLAHLEDARRNNEEPARRVDLDHAFAAGVMATIKLQTYQVARGDGGDKVVGFDCLAMREVVGILTKTIPGFEADVAELVKEELVKKGVQ